MQNKNEAILVLGASSFLGRKIYKTLKREHLTFGIQETEKLFGLENLSFNSDIEQIKAYIIYKRIKKIILTKEYFLEIKQKNIDIINFIKYIDLQKIELIFINDLSITGFKKVLNAIKKKKPLLWVDVSGVYGYSYELRIEKKQLNNYVLADYIAEWLEKNINQRGYIKLQNQKNDIFDQTVEKQKGCILNLIYNLNPRENFLGINIAKARIDLGKALEIPIKVQKQIDFVSPVPQTGVYYAMGLSEKINRPYIQVFEKKKSIRSFQIQEVDSRKKILWSNLQPIRDLIFGKNIALVDEAIFTGITLKIACEMLRECGVNKIYLCIPTPKCKFQCKYYIQPQRKMLMDYISEELCTTYFNIDGIIFQKEKIFLDYITKVGSSCSECFYGRR